MPVIQTFEMWWHDKGSGITPRPGDDMESHAKRVAEAAYCEGWDKHCQDVIPKLKQCSEARDALREHIKELKNLVAWYVKRGGEG